MRTKTFAFPSNISVANPSGEVLDHIEKFKDGLEKLRVPFRPSPS